MRKLDYNEMITVDAGKVVYMGDKFFSEGKFYGIVLSSKIHAGVNVDTGFININIQLGSFYFEKVLRKNLSATIHYGFIRD